MARSHRIDVGGEIYHCLNRAVGRQVIFCDDSDYQLFEQILLEVTDVTNVAVLAYVIMPNHWHLVLQPQEDGDLSDFMKRLTVTHTQRYRIKTKTVGEGPVYQGRYKSFIIQADKHLLTVLRYVERNPLTANLVKVPKEWKYSSYYLRHYGSKDRQRILSPWPFTEPQDYTSLLQTPLTPKEFEKLERAKDKGVPFGSDTYIMDTVEKYDLQSTQRGQGRPKSI